MDNVMHEHDPSSSTSPCACEHLCSAKPLFIQSPNTTPYQSCSQVSCCWVAQQQRPWTPQCRCLGRNSSELDEAGGWESNRKKVGMAFLEQRNERSFSTSGRSPGPWFWNHFQIYNQLKTITSEFWILGGKKTNSRSMEVHGQRTCENAAYMLLHLQSARQ